MARKVKYLSNTNLIREISLSKTNNQMTDELARMLILLTDRYATRPNWRGYSYIDEMKAAAILLLFEKWDKFDDEKSVNPFSYYTMILQNSFTRTLNTEKVQTDIRDEIMIAHDLVPSLGRQMADD